MKNIQRDVIDKITPEIKKEMEHIWFIADPHHGHPKIVDICNRPIYIPEKDISHISKDQRNIGTPEYKQILNKIHNEWLVKEVFNRYIGKKDHVYLLGDVSLQKRVEAEKFIDRLNGNKHLILGNHCKNIAHSTRFNEITLRKDFTFNRGYLNIHIVLDHFPMASWNRKVHGSWHLFGHVHGRFHNIPLEVEKFLGLSWDVGLDNKKDYIDLEGKTQNHWTKPVNLWDVVQIMHYKQKKKDFLPSLDGEYMENN